MILKNCSVKGSFWNQKCFFYSITEIFLSVYDLINRVFEKKAERVNIFKMHGRWFICHTKITHTKKMFPLHWGYGGTFPSFAQADSYGCMGPNHGRCWSCLKHCLNEDRKKTDVLFSARATVSFCAVIWYVHTGIRIIHTTVNVMVLFCGLHAKMLMFDQFPLCWVLFKYETMHSKAVLMISKAEVQTMLCLWKYKDVSLMSSQSDGH